MRGVRFGAGMLATLLVMIVACSGGDGNQTYEPPEERGVCGNNKVEENEYCDGQEGCAADCVPLEGWTCSTRAPFECESFFPPIETELQDLTPEQQIQVCEWVNSSWRQAFPNICDTLGVNRPVPVDCEQRPSDIIRRETFAGCHMSVKELQSCIVQRRDYELCDYVMYAPYCGVELCGLLPNDESCSEDHECESDRCCPTPGEGPTVCLDECIEPKTGDACTSDDSCGDGACVDGVCLVDPLPGGGECFGDDWCVSKHCEAGFCHGIGTKSSPCDSDFDCEIGRVCCANGCSNPDTGCWGGPGSSCVRGCPDTECVDSKMCVHACETDADCGFNPWNRENGCVLAASGEHVCFSGCNNATECQEHFGDDWACDQRRTVDGQRRFICNGPESSSADLRAAD